MKKTIMTLLIIVCALSICACSEVKESSFDNPILFADVAENGGASLLIHQDIDLSPDHHVLEANENVECEINNEKITGTYEETVISPFYGADTDVYNATGPNGETIIFRINRVSGKVELFHIINKEDHVADNGDKTYDECMAIAKEKLNEINTNGNTYVLSDDVNQKRVVGGAYSFYFDQMVQDHPVYSSILIKVNTKGIVTHINATNSFDFSEQEINTILSYKRNDDGIIQEVRKRLNESSDKDFDVVPFSIIKSLFCKLKDGHIYVLHELELVYPDYRDGIRILEKIS